MAKRQPLTYTLKLKLPDGNVVPWEELTEEQIENWRAEATERSRKYLNAYYANHPEEYDLLPDG